jgi:DNA repair ATPase RecN
MLNAIEVRHFQSLHHVALELAPFTVIVGPSSSGKSALGRAVRMLTSNARGSSFITHGETVCTVSATTEHGQVTLRKGKEDSYVVVPSDPEQTQRTFTKLGGAVPEEVSTFLGIPPKDAINYAGQFDRPYLLDDTGNEVARTLGELTNVTMVFEAARESRRAGLAQSSTLKTRRSDLAADEARVDEYRGLKGQREALDRAETAISEAGRIRARIERLTHLTTSLASAGAALRAIEDLPAVPDIQRVREAQKVAQRLARLRDLVAGLKPLPQVPAAPPSADAARAIVARIDRFQTLREQMLATEEIASAADDAWQAAMEARADAEADRLRILSEAGTCPTCGQNTKHLEHA